MKSIKKIETVRLATHSEKDLKGIIIKGLALSIPVTVMIVGLFLPLREVVRQALVGVILIWLYAGAMTGFSFLE